MNSNEDNAIALAQQDEVELYTLSEWMKAIRDLIKRGS